MNLSNIESIKLGTDEANKYAARMCASDCSYEIICDHIKIAKTILVDEEHHDQATLYNTRLDYKSVYNAKHPAPKSTSGVLHAQESKY